MHDNYPEGIDRFGPPWMDDNAKSELIENNLDLLRDFHAEHVADGILDDDMTDEFNSWVVKLPEQELLAILNK